MKNRIQIAADNMLKKGTIDVGEHNELCKVAFKFKSLLSGVGDLGGQSSNIMNALKGLAIISAGGYAAKEVVVDPLVQKHKINKSFAAMTEKVPQLADADQDQMKDYFGVVKTFSPKSASNPLVAGALVNKMMQFGGVDHKLVQDISAIQAGLPQPRVAPTVVESVAKAVATPRIPTEKTTAEFDSKGQVTGYKVTQE